MTRRLAPLALAPLALALIAPAVASAQATCPLSFAGPDAGELRNQPLTRLGDPPGQGSPFLLTHYGASPDVPSPALGAPRGFSDPLVADGAGTATVEALLSTASPLVLAARVGPSSDPRELPVVAIDWRAPDGSVVQTQVAEPQPCPEHDGSVTIWRTVAAVQRPQGAGAYRVRVTTPPGRASFIDGLSLIPYGADRLDLALVGRLRAPHLRVAGLLRTRTRLVVTAHASDGLTAPSRVTVSGTHGGPLVGRIAPPTPDRQAPTRTFRLPKRLRSGPLSVTLSYGGDRSFRSEEVERTVHRVAG